MKFFRKGKGRIFVDKRENIPKVINEIVKQDRYEAKYLPDDFVTDFTNYPSLVYNGKFDELDLGLLTKSCADRGIMIACYAEKMEADA